MTVQEHWFNFTLNGDIKSYLAYVSARDGEKGEKEKNEVHHRGLDNK